MELPVRRDMFLLDETRTRRHQIHNQVLGKRIRNKGRFPTKFWRPVRAHPITIILGGFRKGD